MTREIKFRAWHNQRKEMFNPMPIIDFKVMEINGHHLMQFTGLQDKNGIDIYEGDIVEGIWHGKTIDKDIFGVVDFKEGMFGIENTIDGEPYTINRLYIKVIGNIHEHPHLLVK
jgi:uncharacterized phage protein (TIGR01671 family)